MNFELELTTRETGDPIRRMWPLYTHDVSAYDGRKPNRHGILSDDEDLVEFEGPGGWWSNSEVLFPYLARVDDRPAGFNLIAGGALAEELGVDFAVYELFVAAAYRGTAVATQLAVEGIARHRGRWEVVTYVNAPRPAAFWRKVLPQCATGEVVESEEDHAFGRRVCWRFSNR